jgi:Leucine-rich repeat (LRR) protein
VHDPLSNENSADVWEASSDADLSLEFDAPLLEEVDLHSNKFTSLPPALLQLESLKRLDVSYNELASLPFELWMSRSLCELNLSHNKLATLPNLYSGTLVADPSSHLPMKGDSPSSSAPPTPKHSIQEEETQEEEPSEVPASSTANDQCHDLPLSFISHWQSKVRVETSQGLEERDQQNEKALLELNLSHNLFETVPHGLACLAPQLQKLILSSNLLTQIGPLNAFPVGLRSLDLSNNTIGDAEPREEEGPSFRVCLNPLQQLKPNRRYQ